MRAARQAIFGFFDTLSGRLGVLLAFGLVVASLLSLTLAEHARRYDFAHVRLERVVDSVADMYDRFTSDPQRTQALLLANRILGARDAPPGWSTIKPDPALTGLLAKRLGSEPDARATAMSQAACFPNFDLANRAAGVTDITLPECWYVVFHDGNGIERKVAVDLMPFRVPPSSIFDPLSLLLIASVAIALAVVGARFATTPLRKLKEAAHIFSVTIDPEPIKEDGPREVRAALATFNLMQSRVRDGFRERTKILASVTHDLQTPLTRLRLRLEQVENEQLRERLVADLAVTQKLVRDGLDYARSVESTEPWSVVDLDSILSSIAEDASEFGADVQFLSGCGVEIKTKPNALQRCVTNLVDNSIKYAGNAELSSEIIDGELRVSVSDRGPGIPDAEIDRMLMPFQRSEGNSEQSGSGLGLAIVVAQGKTFGAALELKNREPRGLVATLRIPRV
jgi:signal transduction histidine kinase